MKRFSSFIFFKWLKTAWCILLVHNGFLNNELQAAIALTRQELLFACELRVTVYCTGYELLFACELRVTLYCTGYELLFTCELRVTVYCTGYELLFACELGVTICYSSGCNCHFICESRHPLIYFKY